MEGDWIEDEDMMDEPYNMSDSGRSANTFVLASIPCEPTLVATWESGTCRVYG